MINIVNKFSFAVLVVLSLFSMQVNAQINTPAGATVPFGSNKSYPYGIMPTTLPTSGSYGSASEIADKYNSWKTNYIENCGTDKARVKFDNTSETVSEGIGYGMLLAAYAADKDLFNRLWAYYKQYRNGNGVMHWKISGCNSVIGQNGATDAELDAAMALVVANYQWPNTTSPHNYKTDAVALINAIKSHEINASDYTFENGDTWKPACRNPSYQAPGYARVFKVFMAENGQAANAFWDNVIQKTESLLISNAHATSGLATNWCTPAGPPSSSCSGSGTAPDKFGYDACRAPWREGVDYIWYGPSAMQTITNKQTALWISKGGAGSVRGGDGINQDGSGSGDHNAAFVGPIGAMSLSASNTTANQQFCNAMYAENKNDALTSGYFTKILQMIGLFVQTGNFWNPYTMSVSTTTSVSLTAPTVTTASEGDAITISASTTVTSGSISKVEFYAGTVLIGTDNNAPYSINWTANATGSVSITAVATNTNGDVATSAATTVSIYKAVNQTGTAPAIDGTEGTIWSSASTAALNNVIDGTISNSADLSAYYKAMWDASYFYLLVNVTDNTKTNNAGTDIYNDDAVEVFFDIGNNKATTYGANDFQYTFRWNDNTIYEKNSKITGVTFAKTDNGTGYIMTMRFPWSTLTGTPSVNQLVGFDVAVNDDDDGGARDGKMAWSATQDQAWTNPSYMGTVVLKGSSCTNPSAAGAITGIASTCANSTGITYSIASVTGATGYTWTVPTGATITAGAGTNSITISFGTTGGTVSVVPTNTCGSGAASNTTVTVSASVTPAVSVTASATTICAGTSVTFTATPTNGGTPTYQWRKNGTDISGATAATYTASTLANNDKIDAVMTSTANCRSANTATSAQTTITVTSSVTPAVSVTASATTICAGTSVTFTATPTNGGTPTYQWRKNSTNISGATAATYTVSTLANNDKIDVVMTSTANCRSANTATSAQTTITVTSSVTPAVSIASSATTICAGTSVTFTATPTNGGTPTYQWRKNGTNISGATAATYTVSTLANNDQIDVVMTSTASCRSANTATSAQTVMTVNASITPSVAISASATTICAGTSVSFTAVPTNGGTPTYQWRKNGTAISGATGATYAASTLVNNDKIDVVMTSTVNCRTANTAASAQATITVNANVTPAVTASASQTTICTGTTVNFTASPVNGGTPTYQWRKNGANISGATAATYSTSNLANNNTIDVVMTSNANCRTANTATSGPVVITVATAVTAAVTIEVNPGSTAYAGQAVTFTAYATNGGSNPAYQWKINGAPVEGATAATYTTTALTNGNAVSVTMTSNASCVSVQSVNSNSITMTIKANPAFDSSVTGPGSVNANQTTVIYSVSSQDGMTYNWTVPAGATIVSGQGTNAIVVNFGSTGGTVSVLETNPLGQTVSVSKTVTISTATPVLVGSGEVQISVFPIPCNDVLNVNMQIATGTVVSYTFIDMAGNTIQGGTFESSGDAGQLALHMAAGMYQLVLHWDGKTQIKKIIKY
ncbi:MAG: glycosyl hydrolase family 8 [Cytophaga sp.]|uniref:glycosyl hydrolase family 8 n=1 Tax=Cytophaga sp. TaxID=29535 RepID=UPI003F7EBD41